MRIISQDGLYDVPYEAIAIRFNEDDSSIILGVPLSVISEDLVSDVPLITLGTYSTEEKAEKAMEMLRTAYIGKPMMYKAKDIAEAYKEATEKDLLMMFDSKINNVFIAKANIFQFPQDEDLEV